MKKLIFILVFAAFLFNLEFATATYSLIKESYVSGAAEPTSTSPTAWRGQTFQVKGGNFVISDLSMMFNSTTAAGLNLNFLLQYVNGTGSPTPINVSYGNLTSTGFDTTLKMRNVSMSPALLQNNNNYSISVYTTTGSSLGLYYNLTGNFTFGNFTQSADSGATWTLGQGDAPFILYGSLTGVFLNTPESSSNIINSSITFNSTYFTNNTLKNITLFVWNPNNAIFNTTRQDISNLFNSTLITFNNFATIGIYKWNVYLCDVNDVCNFAEQNSSFTFGVIQNNITFNAGTYETSRETFVLNTTLFSTPTAEATFYYNGTDRGTATKTTIGSDTYFTSILDIPTTPGTKSFYWVMNLDGTLINSSTNTQIIAPINLTLCSAAPQNIPYVNFTFRNETNNQESVKSQFTSSWSYYLGAGLSSKALSYSNTTENNNYTFCFTPQNKTLNINVSGTYVNAESQQRSFNYNATLTNITTQKVLFLLPTSLGQYVTFQVTNPAEQAVIGALVSATSSTFGDIQQAITDSSGGVTFWLNPLSTYTITVIASGYNPASLIVTPSQTIYTIQLGTVSNSSQEDYTKGITTTIKPTPFTTLVNGTSYNFNFTISSTFWNLESFGYTLGNGTAGLVFISNSSTSSTGGFLGSNLNTGANKTIVMNYFYVINGTYTNSTVYWNVNTDFGTDYSLLRLMRDLKTYVNSGMFGLDNFGLGLIVFFVIFIFSGVMAFKFGLTSPAAIMGIVAALVALFDVGFNLVPNPIGAISYFPTVFVFIIFMSLVIREGVR